MLNTAYPDIPEWSPAAAGNTDTYWLDISAWSAARNGEIPSGTITVASSESDFTATSATYYTGTPFLVGALSFVGSGGTANKTYVISFTFTTNYGNTITKYAKLPVIGPYQ